MDFKYWICPKCGHFEDYKKETKPLKCPKCGTTMIASPIKPIMIRRGFPKYGYPKYGYPKYGYPKTPTKAAFSIKTNITEFVLDEEENSVRVTLIKAGMSKNNRFYSPDVLKESVSLFESSKCYVDHSGDDESLVRSVRDLVGSYENIFFEDDSIKGTLVILSSTKDWLMPIVREQPKLIGLSIDVTGQVKAGKIDGYDCLIVEKLHSVRSVDLVTEPAAGGQIGESFLEPVITSTELREDFPELVGDLVKDQTIQLENKSKDLDKKIVSLENQIQNLVEDRDNLKSDLLGRERRDYVESSLAESKLPENVRSKNLRNKLISVSAKDFEEFKKVVDSEIKEREDLISGLQGQIQGLGEQTYQKEKEESQLVTDEERLKILEGGELNG